MTTKTSKTRDDMLHTWTGGEGDAFFESRWTQHIVDSWYDEGNGQAYRHWVDGKWLIQFSSVRVQR